MFEQWWNTLTIKEQTMIGKNNAKFVWQQACDACISICNDNIKYCELHRSTILAEHSKRLATDIKSKTQV